MITLESNGTTFTLNTTIFPDKTSQVWKIPEEFLNGETLKIKWNFEHEGELIHLFQLKPLLRWNSFVKLYIPYLPYARQDKMVSNETTFAMHVFADLLNKLEFYEISAYDVHNPNVALKIIHNFVNREPVLEQETAIKQSEADYIVFPDKGAKDRYSNNLVTNLPMFFCEKVRDQSTGQITAHNLDLPSSVQLKPDQTVLIIDDICDGGATFINVANTLHNYEPNVKVKLFVSHGIFSKGKHHLLTNGISEIYTTNSLLKNLGEYNV